MALTPPVKEAAKTAQYGPIVAKVGSKSSDEIYEIRRSHEGNLTCQCMSFRFSAPKRPASEKFCKHTVAYKNDVVQSPIPAFQKTSTVLPVPQTPKSVYDEAKACATEILGPLAARASVTKATTRIEEAIRKFMSALPSAMPPMVPAGVGGLLDDSEVRMIMLDE